MKNQDLTNKIAVNCRFLSQRITGVQRAAVEISRHIKQLEPSIVFLSPKKIIHSEIADELHAIPIGSFSSHLWEQVDLPLYLKTRGKPVLLNFCNLAPVCYKRNIITIHDISPVRHPEWFSRKYRTYYRIMTPLLARRAEKILTDSTFSKNEMVDLLKIKPGKIDVVPLAVPTDIAVHREKTFPNEFGRYILAVSSIDPRKNLVGIIDAYLKAKLGDVKLVIAGSENRVFADSGLKARIQGRDDIILTGYVDDEKLAGLYQNAICLVYISLYEGFGLPPLEIMTFGRPAVVSPEASLPEVCGNAVLYADARDTDDMAGKIRRLVNDAGLQNNLVEKAKLHIQKFDWQKTAQSVLDVAKKYIKVSIRT